MEILRKVFNHYVIHARITVVFFISLPFVILALAWIPETKGWSTTIITILVSFGCFSFLSNVVSNRGVTLEQKLFRKWGGKPTTILLRHRDETIDPYTKSRIHTWLQKNIPGLTLPSTEEELSNPENADRRYESAVNYLREYTRDRKQYRMVYDDLVAYGFARNLLALKKVGIIIVSTCLAFNTLLILHNYNNLAFVLKQVYLLDLETLKIIGAECIAIVFLMVYVFFIGSNHVEQRAFRYAKTLLSVCDTSSQP